MTKQEREIAAAKKLVAESKAAAEPVRTEPKETKGSLEGRMDLIGVKVDILHPADLKAFVELVSASEGVLPKHLRALGDAIRDLPEAKPIPPSLKAMLKQMGKPVPPSESPAERLKKAIMKLSPDERVEVTKSMELYIARSQRRGQKTG